MNKITVYLKSGGDCTLESKETLNDLKNKYLDLLNPKKKKSLLILQDEKSVTLIPKDNISAINVSEVTP